MKEKESTPADPKGREGKTKRPYERPRIVWQSRIEARAVACAKLPGNPSCDNQGPITS